MPLAPRLDVVVGLGSNLGDRLAHLQEAARELGERFEVRARSRVYETAPVGPSQPDYLNAAVRLSASVTPQELLVVLLTMEAAHGRFRARETRWGARTLDLDVLWGDGLVVASDGLTVPHARLAERAFALRPLLDVAPDAAHPETGARFVVPEGDSGVRETAFVL